jgi:hypothetical protein
MQENHHLVNNALRHELHHFLDLWVLALELGISSWLQWFRNLPVDWQSQERFKCHYVLFLKHEYFLS